MNDSRLDQYKTEPNGNEYRGFSLKGGKFQSKNTGNVKLTLKNGDKEITVIGDSKDDALIQGFDEVDRYLNK